MKSTLKQARTKLLCFSVLAGLLLAACQPATLFPERETLFQYSLLSSLMAGGYDGELRLDELQRQGDFGLGTFNSLDGEMIVLDGQVYQVTADGVAHRAAGAMQTPFAAVTFFEPDQQLELPGPLSCAELKAHIDQALPSQNLPYAVRVRGHFAALQTRSVPPQQPPYRPLSEVLETQPTFDLQDVRGTIVGFCLPDYMAPANAAGYHFHFLDDAKTTGGHVLDCQADGVTVEIDVTGEWQVLLPGDEAFLQVELEEGEYR